LDLSIAAVVGASVVDAINPCAFAVLIILMTTILASGGGKKALKSGLAFAASIFVSYFLMGLGLYKALGTGEVSHLFYGLVGWLAILLGLFNLKDYFWYGRGFLMEVPMAWRPKLKGIIQSVASPVGAFGIGFVVSLFLLPCTSGPYIVILGMLAKKAFQTQAIAYLILYNLIFVLPMVLISYAVYRGFDPKKAEKIRQKRLRTLHLIAGLIMLAMGVVILGGWL
jgi:cytochrome c biogenesis protein CcdA